MSVTPKELPAELLNLENQIRSHRAPIRTRELARSSDRIGDSALQYGMARSVWREHGPPMPIVVSPAMEPVLMDAYINMPASGFMPHDLPSPSGVLYVDYGNNGDPDDPAGGELLLGWCHLPPEKSPGNGKEDADYQHGCLVIQPFDKLWCAQDRDDEFVLGDTIVVGFNEEPDLPAHFIDGHPVSGDEASLAGGHIATLFSFCHLLRQRTLIDDSTVIGADRATRRRYHRDHREPPEVRVITLRSPSRSSTTSSEREYHHRWIVRGHWRHQWYPSIEAHRPVYIAPHVKGPEDAPLLGGSKVYQVVR